MGRFASTVEFYSRCRELYPPEFFRTVAARIALRGDEALLDVGCGPGLLAVGFAPFVGSCTGLDPEAAMIEAARVAAKEAGVHLTLHLGRIEDLPGDRIFETVTIGRALHWLDRGATLQVLDRIVSERGRVLICGATSIETPAARWVKPYEEIRSSWAADPDRKRYEIELTEWFAGSRFCELDNISVTHPQQVTITDLVGRALSKSNTSPAVVGNRQSEFEAAIRAVLEPFSQDGVVEEEIVSRATVFGRPT
jgi:SAM-dependent methyltransferase